MSTNSNNPSQPPMPPIGHTPVNTSPVHDLASAATALRNFSGSEQDDVYTWEKELMLYQRLFELNENNTIRLIVMKLRDKAQTWAANFLHETPVTTSQTLLAALKKQFSNTAVNHAKLSKFLKMDCVRDKKEYEELISTADEIYQRRNISELELMKLTIARCPEAIRPLLVKFTHNDGEWYDFVREAREFVWIVFDERKFEVELGTSTRMDVMAINNQGKPRNPRNNMRYKGKKNCMVHGDCDHYTRECTLMENMKKRGVKVFRENRINNIEEYDEEGEDIIKRDNRYCFKNRYNQGKCIRNPFKVSIKPEAGIEHNALLDTGADVSLMNKRMVPAGCKINKNPNLPILRSASGNNIPIIGKTNINFTYLDKEYKFNPYVTKQNISYSILGRDFISENNGILMNILDRCNPPSEDFTNKKNMFPVESDNEACMREKVFSNFAGMFKTEIDDLNLCNLGKHTIKTKTEEPIRQFNFRMPIHLEKVIDEEVQKLIRLGIIRVSESEWNSRVVPITKPDGSLRLCIDFRPLNNITVKEPYPMPVIDEIIDNLSGSKIFSTIDAKNGYYQIALNDDSIHKTAFTWKRIRYEFLRMPFGLCNAPTTYQKLMDKLLAGEDDAQVYLDDIILKSKNVEDHKLLVERVLLKLKGAGIKLNKEKCKFYCREIRILGSIIKDGKVYPNPDKIDLIGKFKVPETIKELRSFLGMCSHNRSFVKNFSLTTGPLYELLKGHTKRSTAKISWSKEDLKNFEKTKKMMLQDNHRFLPDLTKRFILTTDASKDAVGGILSQINDNGVEAVVGLFSKKFDKTQQNYSVTDKELFAAVKGIEFFRHYLLGTRFTLRTDHLAIKSLWTTNNLNGRLMRWSLILQEYNFDVEYVRGEDNGADYLSRVFGIEQRKEGTFSREEIKSILEEYHIKSGHGSANSMKFLLRRKYKWSNMYADIDEYVAKCVICLKSGEKIAQTKNNVVSTSRPNELWEIDLIGRVMDKYGNNFYILVGIDHYTKWVETHLLKNKTGEEVAKVIEEKILKRHGIPERILTDNGCEFRNQSIEKLKAKYKLKWEFNSPGHHETMGCVERANKSIFSNIRKLSNYGKQDWRKVIEDATYGYNISLNRAIGTSPMLIKYGRVPDMEVDKIYDKVGWTTPIDHLRKVRDKKFREYAEKNIVKGKRFDGRRFEIGEKVLIFKDNNEGKIETKWKEGYKVMKVVREGSYVVSDGVRSFHLNKEFIKKDKRFEEDEGVSLPS